MSNKTKTYEGMFLLDAGNPDFHATTEPVRTVLGRYNAEILALKPWDERKLAYEVLGRKRGLYVLTYFRADPQCIKEIEHDCQLSERILRALILRQDRLTEQQINAETPATSTAHRAPEAGEAPAPARPAEAPAEDEAPAEAEALAEDEAAAPAESADEESPQSE